MKWKIVDIYPEFKGLYKVSEFGDIISLPRTIKAYNSRYGIQFREKKESVLTQRTNGLNPHKFVDFTFVSVSDFGDKLKFGKTVYVHRLVAEMFKKKPNNKEKKFVEHIKDDYSNNHYSNLRWITQSELQLRNMHERYPENKNKLRDANIKSGYYKRAGNKRPVDVAKLYYQLRGNRLTNKDGKIAALTAVPLQGILKKFEHKLTSFAYFRFSRLSANERIQINELLVEVYTRKKAVYGLD